MIKSKLKYLFIIIITAICMLILSTNVFAANENVKIVKDDSGNYMIYIKDNDYTNFEFAFSNDKSQDKSTLSFIPAAKDSNSEDARRIAFIDNKTGDKDYLWVKNGENYILEAIQIDLSDSIEKNDMEEATNITKIIDADSTKTYTTETQKDGKKITLTVGEVVLQDENGSYSYITIKLPNSEEYNNFMKLATKISKLSSDTDMYSQIEIYSEFYNLFENLKPNADAGWTKIDKNIIYQPDDAEDGDEYIVWIKDNKTGDIDVQFLTSTKKYSEEKIKEAITTKLPVTYEDNTLLFIFAIVVVLIIAVSIRIKVLNKKGTDK